MHRRIKAELDLFYERHQALAQWSLAAALVGFAIIIGVII